MRPTLQDFDELLERTAKKLNIPTEYIKSAGRPRAAEGLAFALWLAMCPEDADSRSLRAQLRHLKVKGWFNLEGILP